MIHGENDLLDKLLFIMSRENRLRTVIDEQNNLYQVRRERERESESVREGGVTDNLAVLLNSSTIKRGLC